MDKVIKMIIGLSSSVTNAEAVKRLETKRYGISMSAQFGSQPSGFFFTGGILETDKDIAPMYNEFTKMLNTLLAYVDNNMTLLKQGNITESQIDYAGIDGGTQAVIAQKKAILDMTAQKYNVVIENGRSVYKEKYTVPTVTEYIHQIYKPELPMLSKIEAVDSTPVNNTGTKKINTISAFVTAGAVAIMFLLNK